MNIAVIVPYWCPDENTEALFQRCRDSIDSRFHILCREDKQHAGVSVMRNKALDYLFKNYEPDYITFLDADDIMVPDAYEQIIEAIKEEPEEQIIQLNHCRRRPNGVDFPKFFNKRGTYYLKNLPKFWVGVWNKVYKASLIKDIRFIPGLDHGEDEVFNLECLAKARRIYCSERIHMTHCFDNPNSLSKTAKGTELINEQKALLSLLERYSQTDPELCGAVRIRQAELWTNQIYQRTFGGTYE